MFHTDLILVSAVPLHSCPHHEAEGVQEVVLSADARTK